MIKVGIFMADGCEDPGGQSRKLPRGQRIKRWKNEQSRNFYGRRL